MTRINLSSELLAVIRGRVAAADGSPAGHGPGSSTPVSLAPPSAATSSPSPRDRASSDDAATASVRAVESPSLALALQGIARDDPWRRRKAFALFMGEVLAEQFGITRGGRDFDRMVRQVIDRMEADPHLARKIAEAAELLLESGLPADGKPAPAA